MLKRGLFILSLISCSLNAVDYDRVDKAFKELDCEFKDCSEPKEIIKEKIVPVYIIKERVVEKPVEKVIYKEREPRPQPKEIVNINDTSGDDKTYNKAFFDIYLKSQNPMLDYITYHKRGSFDIEQYLSSVNGIREKNIDIKIEGKIEIPSSINTNQVYINSGTEYYCDPALHDYKAITYNNSDKIQSADNFLVNVKRDTKGNRYIDYTINIGIYAPYRINAKSCVTPQFISFKVAPKTRGFKKLFVPAKIYIYEE